MSVHIFGIRHHGVGSARSLRRALDELQPDAVLIEGPPDADPIIPLIGQPDMQPPVALLVYNAVKPREASWFPFAVYSPEWQALQYALAAHVHVQFMDLPQKHMLAMRAALIVAGNEEGEVTLAPVPDTLTPQQMIRLDPLRALAEAAGYADSERWWEHLIEERRDSTPVFEAVLEAMSVLREIADISIPGFDIFEAEREAWMRTTICTAEKKFQRIAVICGAWHSPALVDRSHTAEDRELLRDLPSVKTTATWAPWTYSRLARDSGYGAGIESPGWYHHLWESTPVQISTRWMSRVAGLLRSEDLSASTAQVIDGVRLAETLAALRDRPLPGLAEMNEAALSVFCKGDAAPLTLIRDRLIIGQRMGQVPADAPTVPLQRDLEAQQKSLRLKPSLEIKQLDLDLRQLTDLARSYLLHRLMLLDISWGTPERNQVSAKGTFHEFWRLVWSPELAVLVIEASVWGNTVEDAAANRARDLAFNTPALPRLSELLQHVLLADLPDAARAVMRCVQDSAALTTDTALLMDTLPSMVDMLRYGSVRQTDAGIMGVIVDGLVTRISIGLLPACAGLDDDAAGEMLERLIRVNSAIGLLQNEMYSVQWQQTLRQIAESEALHNLLMGRATRILHDMGVLDSGEVLKRMRLALSSGIPYDKAAAWIEGFLKGSGALLLHDEHLWITLDEWVSALPAESFDNVLPLLRRVFSTFHSPERRQMGERVRQGQRAVQTVVTDVDRDRAERVLPVLKLLLGVES